VYEIIISNRVRLRVDLRGTSSGKVNYCDTLDGVQRLLKANERKALCRSRSGNSHTRNDCIGLFSGTISKSSQMTQCRIIL